MSRNRFESLNCSIARALDEVGDWWTLLIVRDTVRGVDTFDGFLASLGIATNILASRLRRLVKKGILSRLQDDEDGRRLRYRLTKKGKALAPVIVALMQWGDQWLTGKGHEPRLLQDRSTGDRVALVEIRTTKGAKVVADDLSFVPGPGAHSPRPRGKGLIVRGRSKKKAARTS